MKIDEYEKLYIMVASKSSRGTLVDEETFNEKDFEDIKTLEQYIIEKRNSNTVLNKNISNYYMIPMQNKQVVRIGDEEVTRIVKTHALVDSDGYSLYTIMEDGRMSMSNVLREETKNYIMTNYKRAVEKKLVTVDDVLEYLNFDNIDKLAVFMDSNDFSLKDIDKAIDNFMLSKIITDSTYEDKEVGGKDISTLQDYELDEYENPGRVRQNNYENLEQKNNNLEKPLELENNERLKDIFNKAGINDNALKTLLERNSCQLDQINIRILGSREALEYTEELTGANLRGYRAGQVMAIRVPKMAGGDRLYLANIVTGERITIRNSPEKNVDDVEEIFKYDWRPGLDTKQAMKRPKEVEGQISYMTYIDKNGDIKELRYINNGKQNDLSREERQRYLAEVEEADEILKDAIEEHEKTSTQESHLRVKEAMKNRVAVDKKYDVLEKQRDVTKESLENAKDIVEDDDGMSINKEHDEDDDWGPWSRYR